MTYGVGSCAIRYLHEEWAEQVVHRNIAGGKESDVTRKQMYDSSMLMIRQI